MCTRKNLFKKSEAKEDLKLIDKQFKPIFEMLNKTHKGENPILVTRIDLEKLPLK